MRVDLKSLARRRKVRSEGSPPARGGFGEPGAPPSQATAQEPGPPGKRKAGRLGRFRLGLPLVLLLVGGAGAFVLVRLRGGEAEALPPALPPPAIGEASVSVPVLPPPGPVLPPPGRPSQEAPVAGEGTPETVPPEKLGLPAPAKAPSATARVLPVVDLRDPFFHPPEGEQGGREGSPTSPGAPPPPPPSSVPLPPPPVSQAGSSLEKARPQGATQPQVAKPKPKPKLPPTPLSLVEDASGRPSYLLLQADGGYAEVDLARGEGFQGYRFLAEGKRVRAIGKDGEFLLERRSDGELAWVPQRRGR